MCASLISLLLILVSCSMVTEGLPLSRRERGVHQDLIAGADFLSVLMESPAVRQAYRELTTTAAPSTTVHSTLQIPSNSLNDFVEEYTPVVRESRNTRSTTAVEQHTFTQVPNNYGAKILPTSDRTKVQSNQVNPTKHSSETNKTSLIISVHISSSEGDSHINKITHDAKSNTDLHTLVETTSQATTQGDQTVISSEEHPSIIAEANKSEFSVDESEPITRNSGSYDAYTHEYPASVQSLPSPQSSSEKEKVPSFEHHSVIYHDNPREPVQGRSVSYSTVIQSLPKQPKTWTEPNHNHRERQERHYEVKDGASENQFEKPEEKRKSENYASSSNKSTVDNPSSSVAESNDYFITSKYESSSDYRDDLYSERKETSWEKPEEAYVSESSSKKHQEPTEKNWEVSEKQHEQQEKPYSPPTTTSQKSRRVPVVYGKPEQNYEVDESVSVVSNGRVHGVQPLKPQISTPAVEVRTDQANDNQKVGYVVEGRNYRKYRVEERTSDGFIVGEYGVVSHDDGSLRGVRYTADGTINPRLIYDALMKFLSL